MEEELKIATAKLGKLTALVDAAQDEETLTNETVNGLMDEMGVLSEELEKMGSNLDMTYQIKMGQVGQTLGCIFTCVLLGPSRISPNGHAREQHQLALNGTLCPPFLVVSSQLDVPEQAVIPDLSDAALMHRSQVRPSRYFDGSRSGSVIFKP